MPKRNIIWLISILCTAFAAVVVTRSFDSANFSPSFRGDTRLQRVYDIISSNYYHDIPTDVHRSRAIQGMVASLDEYSSYIPPEKADEFRRSMSGKTSSNGLRVGINDDELIVLSVLPGSPAARAGIEAADRILEVDGNAVPIFEGDLAGKMIGRLEQGDFKAAELTVLRRTRGDGQLKMQTLKFNIVRDTDSRMSVEGLFRESTRRWNYMADEENAIVYVKIREFVDSTISEIQAALRQPARVRGLVLDLRDNPGGSLERSVAVANLFLSEGVIVTVQDNHGGVTRRTAHEAGTYPNFPMVVLVNENTASAAEVVAGALQKYNRALIAGTETKGKFYVQSVFDMGDELGIINLTTARFFVGDVLPTNQVAARPITPDLVVDFTGEPDMLNQLRENIPESRPAETQENIARQADELDRVVRIERIVAQDSQLQEAMELLEAPAMFELLLKKEKLPEGNEVKDAG